MFSYVCDWDNFQRLLFRFLFNRVVRNFSRDTGWKLRKPEEIRLMSRYMLAEVFLHEHTVAFTENAPVHVSMVQEIGTYIDRILPHVYAEALKNHPNTIHQHNIDVQKLELSYIRPNTI